MPQVADDHEQALITAEADARFFQHPQVLADLSSIVIAARILRLAPEQLLSALDDAKESLAAWDCPASLLEFLKAEQVRLQTAYEGLRTQVQDVAGATKGALASQVAAALLSPLTAVDLGKALWQKKTSTRSGWPRPTARPRPMASSRGSTPPCAGSWPSTS